MDSHSNIVLTGFMGTGKSTVGRLIAAQLGREFLDMDECIERREQRKISEIFATDGEPAFRRMERALVQELSAKEDLVIATGGGVVLNPDNIKDYSRNGLVVCLTAPAEVILRRVSRETHRPLLEDGEKSERIIRLLESRRALYESIPHRIDTTTMKPEQVAECVLQLFRQACA
jgi:shikimate kinase